MARTPQLKSIDLNLFMLFDAVYSEGGLTAAGRKLGLSQPAVSHALSRLRHALGDPLFVRQGAAVVPTPFARHIIGDVRRALGILEGRLQDHRRFDPASAQANFRLAMREGMEAILLPPLMARLATEAPGVSIASVRVGRRELETELAGGVDLAIDIAIPVGIDIRRETLTADRLIVAARRDHPALAEGLTLDIYLALGHVLVSSRRRGPALEDFELNRLGYKRRIMLRCHSKLAALNTVACTDLLLTTTERHLPAAMLGLPLAVHDLPFEATSLDAHLYWHADVDDDPANAWLRRTVTAIV